MNTTPPPAAEGLRARKRQRMASHLAVTAMELFEQRGYDSVTMEQIAAEAEVAKGTLYSYFPMKEALVAERFKEEIIAGMEDLAGQLAAHQTFRERMGFLLRQSAAWHEARKPYLPHFLHYLHVRSAIPDDGAGSHAASDVTLDILKDMFLAGQRSGEVESSLSADALAWSFQFLLHGAVSAWLARPEAILADEFLMAFDLLMDGAGANRSRGPSGSTTSSLTRRCR